MRACHPLLKLAPRGGRVVVIGSKNVPAPGPGRGGLLRLQGGAQPARARRRARMGRGRHPHQHAASERGVRHRRSGPRRCSPQRAKALRPDRRAVQEEQRAARPRCIEPRRRRARRRDVRAAVRQDHRRRRCRSTAATSGSSDGDAVETLRWNGDRARAARPAPAARQDRRTSPAAPPREVAAAIRDMVVRGAPAIGCAAAFGVALDRTASSRQSRVRGARARAARPRSICSGRSTRMRTKRARTYEARGRTRDLRRGPRREPRDRRKLGAELIPTARGS